MLNMENNDENVKPTRAKPISINDTLRYNYQLSLLTSFLNKKSESLLSFSKHSLNKCPGVSFLCKLLYLNYITVPPLGTDS